MEQFTNVKCRIISDLWKLQSRFQCYVSNDCILSLSTHCDLSGPFFNQDMPSVLRGKYGNLLKSHKYFYVDHVSEKSDDRRMSGNPDKGLPFLH